jgi:hypothetical protein
MKLLKTSIAIVGITLCVAACNKTATQNNAAEENAVNAAAPEANAPEANAAAENAALGNMAAPANAEANATGNGAKTDPGPRG